MLLLLFTCCRVPLPEVTCGSAKGNGEQFDSSIACSSLSLYAAYTSCYPSVSMKLSSRPHIHAFHVQNTVTVLQYYQLVRGLSIVLHLSAFVGFPLCLLCDCIKAYGVWHLTRTMWTFSKPAVAGRSFCKRKWRRFARWSSGTL